MQDLSNAFLYLDAALKLNREHPQVLYQMGILMFSSNKIREAIDYFEKARTLKLDTPQLYMYLGLSYEQGGNFEKAKENYGKAILMDPNDTKLRSLLAGVESKMQQNQTIEEQDKQTNMLDDEQGVKMSIPVNKKAVKARLLDDE
jgi:Flp pilus assembly protein TadD